MTLRILHVLDHSLPLHSGYVFRTLPILKEQRTLGWETFQLTSPRQGQDGEVEEVIDELTFYRTRKPRGPGANVPGLRELWEMHEMYRRLEHLVTALEPDILHAHSPVLNALPALRVGRKYRIPVVYELRALWEDAAVDHGSTSEGSFRYRLSQTLETFALRHADHVTTICEGLRANITARGIRHDKVTVIPNAVDITSFRMGAEPDTSLRDRLGLTDSIVLGFAGSFYRYEGLDLLLDALPLLLSRFPSLRVLLLGGGVQEANLKTHAQKLGVSEHVIFTGRVPHNQVRAYYDLIDVLIYPRRSTRLTELVTPLKPLEAMAQGRMLVASDVGGHRELIQDGVTGYLFKAENVNSLVARIEQVLTSRDEWSDMKARARAFVESERNWARSVSRYVDIYSDLRASGQWFAVR